MKNSSMLLMGAALVALSGAGCSSINGREAGSILGQVIGEGIGAAVDSAHQSDAPADSVPNAATTQPSGTSTGGNSAQAQGDGGHPAPPQGTVSVAGSGQQPQGPIVADRVTPPKVSDKVFIPATLPPAKTVQIRPPETSTRSWVTK